MYMQQRLTVSKERKDKDKGSVIRDRLSSSSMEYADSGVTIIEALEAEPQEHSTSGS